MERAFLQVRLGDEIVKIRLVERDRQFFIEDPRWTYVRNVAKRLDSDKVEALFNASCPCVFYRHLLLDRWKVEPSN